MTFTNLTRLWLPAAALAAAFVGLGYAQHAGAATEAATPATVAAEGRAVAASLAAQLESDYTFPAIGRRYAAALRERAASGAYDGLADPAVLAKALTADVQAVHPDGHIQVRVAGAAPRAGGRPQVTPIEEARWLAPGVAYIRFGRFAGTDETVAATDRFMREHAEAKALIFDLRVHHGGGLDEMEAIFPYLYARRTPLVVLESRAAVEAREGAVFEDGPTIRRIDAPEGLVRRTHFAVPSTTETRLLKAKVYVLTSSVTASAAEHFALALKRTHRATLIGSATGGANHFGSFEPVGEHFTAFIPRGRTYDPDTGRDWEATGIAPDVAVAPEDALERALE